MFIVKFDYCIVKLIYGLLNGLTDSYIVNHTDPVC